MPYLALQSDWETRRFYSFLKVDYYGLKTSTLQLQGRIGIAPYIADFDAIHTWLILQISDVIEKNSHTSTLLPIIRVFRDSILVEFGSNFSGDSYINFMYHF